MGPEVMDRLPIYDTLPQGTANDWTMAQDWARFSDAEHAHWCALMRKSAQKMKGLACRAFLDGLEALELDKGDGIPDFAVFNPRFKAATGWEVVAVPGVIPNAVFFEHLSQRRFPVANFLRDMRDNDYNEEPDMFHDVFGHLPMFAEPVFGEFMAAYGRAGLRAEGLGASELLGRLYLHTVEFGLCREGQGLKVMGAGLLSSYSESVHALTSDTVRRLRFDLPRMMRTDYNFDQFQPTYFVIENVEALLEEMETTNLAAVYEELADLSVLAPDARLDSDRVVKVGAP